MIDLSLPSWLNAKKTKNLITAASTWWARAEKWVMWPLEQLDPLEAPLSIVNLLAWQRGITRYETESESLYRRRVKYALINAQDAGSKAGFIAIFERLGIGYIEVTERSDDVNWDIVLLRLTDSQLSDNTELLMKIVQQYGRTCRRYQLTVLTDINVYVAAKTNGHTWDFDVTTDIITPWNVQATIKNASAGTSFNLDIARL